MGETDRLQAGVKLASPTLATQQTILRIGLQANADQKFGDNLEVCLDRFMAAKSYVTCTIAFNPPQIDAPGNAR
jgi:hypothetical protein